MSNEGTVVRVDPATLIVAANVRSNTKVTKEFVASVKLHGVLVPITAQEAEDGLRVVDGQRRTLAALEAGVAEVPVFVVAPLEDAARIVDQVVVNDHREQLDEVEQVLAMKELEQLGVSAAAIAKRTGTKRKAVDGALAVGGSEQALVAMREHQLSFDAAIAIAEFEGDRAAQDRIIRMGASSYAVAQERERRASAALAAEVEAQGVKVIQHPDWDDARIRPASRLYLDEAMTQRLDEVEHEELVRLAGDGLRAWVVLKWTASDGREPSVEYGVSGWKDRGLFAREVPTSSAPKPETPEEISAAKEERRRSRESTKAWSTATGVRVAWLQELLQRRTLPKGWELLSVRRSLASSMQGYPWSMVLTLLRTERSSGGLGKYDVEAYLTEHPTRAPQVALALAVGSLEGAREFDRKGWQGHFGETKPYLELLASWGYELSDVERQVIHAETVAA
ncbi:ParB/RepB/Spo0J family partition protein [Curtobacterium sp. MCBD17_028]|uniref:ParB/RepB/Spo0J family partition protein n=1 Tax=Curtobacterium sp. MCBD17_028 TaxID=2175670 RepID=UPI000DAA286A|nr:ParB N-terminal domain-containing protein [Curtobacterium sp. MCBD17_028]PZE23882.1 hypothetical protein DEI86_13645 [Curtobacterium sp. MCBD17_028]